MGAFNHWINLRTLPSDSIVWKSKGDNGKNKEEKLSKETTKGGST